MTSSTRRGADLALTLIAFAILVASVSLLWRQNIVLLVVTVIECAVALALWHDRLDLSFFFVIGVLGSMAEAVFVHFGVWHYANPTVLGMPIWFPFAFGTTGLIGSRLARVITEMWNEAVPED
jgi:hypothetical protein